MTTTELIDQIQRATADKTPLCIQGGGTKRWYGQAPTGEILATRNYAGIIDYDPSELVITARCGTPLTEIKAALAQKQQMLAFEPPSFGSDATIGGVVASGLSGPRRASAGGIRDFVLGAVLLNGQGERLAFGGQVMKNVAGYDVSRLLAGSMGCLGLIAEVSLKVLPVPRSEISLSFDVSQATALKKLNDWAGQPLPISASTWENHRLTIRLSGSEAATASAKGKLGGELLNDEKSQQHWQDVAEHVHSFFWHQTIWRVSLPATVPMLELGGEQFIEWGGAQRWLTNPTDSADQLRQRISALGGHVTLFKGGDKGLGVFQELSKPIMTIHRRLKSAFDPSGIFNPGRLYPEL